MHFVEMLQHQMYCIDSESGIGVHECCVWRFSDHYMPALTSENQQSDSPEFQLFLIDRDYRIKELTVEMCNAAAAFNLRMDGQDFSAYSRNQGLFRIHYRTSINRIRGACAHISHADLGKHGLTPADIAVYQALVYR